MRHTRIALLATFLFAAASCGGPTVTSAAATPATPKAAIAHQLDLLKAGNVDALKACMTERVREKVTKEIVDKGKEQAGKSSIDDLVDTVEDGMDGANKTAKIKMKNGRTLTTLVEINGKWLADTIWFQ